MNLLKLQLKGEEIFKRHFFKHKKGGLQEEQNKAKESFAYSLL